MKIVFIFIIIICLCSNMAIGQEDIILSYAPLGFVNKVRIKAEFPVKEHMSTGAFLNFYYSSFTGICAEPFYRYYLSGESPCGAYIQTKASLGYFTSKMKFNNGFEESDPNYKSLTEVRDVPGFGVGLAFGYQYITRRGRYFDFFAGYKYMPYLGPKTKNLSGVVYYTDSDFAWISIGPGSMLNGHFGIGYSF